MLKKFDAPEQYKKGIKAIENLPLNSFNKLIEILLKNRKGGK